MRPIALGYLCPRCGKAVTAVRDLRDLAGGPVEAPCACGQALKSCPEGQMLHLTVPCGLCGDTHHAAFAIERLTAADTALCCPRREQMCCFIGAQGVVERRTEELQRLWAKDMNAAEEPFTDGVVMYEVLSELRDIARRPGGITCRCGGEGYTMEVRRRTVDLICAACGTRLRLGAATDRDLDDLCCQMKLQIPGKPRGGGRP